MKSSQVSLSPTGTVGCYGWSIGGRQTVKQNWDLLYALATQGENIIVFEFVSVLADVTGSLTHHISESQNYNLFLTSDDNQNRKWEGQKQIILMQKKQKAGQKTQPIFQKREVVQSSSKSEAMSLDPCWLHPTPILHCDTGYMRSLSLGHCACSSAPWGVCCLITRCVGGNRRTLGPGKAVRVLPPGLMQGQRCARTCGRSRSPGSWAGPRRGAGSARLSTHGCTAAAWFCTVGSAQHCFPDH